MRSDHESNLPPQFLQLRAASLRHYLESGAAGNHLSLLRNFPAGCCKIASIFLLKLVRDLDGTSGFLVAGAKRGEATHAWAEVDAWIVDIAADQFCDFTKPVLVACSSPWHDSWQEAVRFPYTSYGLLSGPHASEYADCLAWVSAHPAAGAP